MAKKCLAGEVVNISRPETGWWFGCHQFYFPRNIGLLSSSQLTYSYFSEGWVYTHPPGNLESGDQLVSQFQTHWIQISRDGQHVDVKRETSGSPEAKSTCFIPGPRNTSGITTQLFLARLQLSNCNIRTQDSKLQSRSSVVTLKGTLDQMFHFFSDADGLQPWWTLQYFSFQTWLSISSISVCLKV